MKTQIRSADHPQSFIEALQILNKGEIVAFPTDTVYGLGVLINYPAAIDRLYTVKGRDLTKSIAVLIGDLAMLELVTTGVNQTVRRIVKCFWPGPLTLVLPRHPQLPNNLSPQPTVGVRMPDHRVAIELLRAAGPMAVTSANLSGAPSTCIAQEVLDQLQGCIPFILDGGRTPGGKPSTVLDCTGDELLILRPGPVTWEQIQAVLHLELDRFSPPEH